MFTYAFVCAKFLVDNNHKAAVMKEGDKFTLCLTEQKRD